MGGKHLDINFFHWKSNETFLLYFSLIFYVLKVHHNSVSANARVPFLHTIPVDQTAGHRKHRAPIEAGRLDAAVCSRRQRWFSRVPRHRARFVAPTGSVPQQKLDGQDGGRVTAAVTASQQYIVLKSITNKRNIWSVYYNIAIMLCESKIIIFVRFLRYCNVYYYFCIYYCLTSIDCILIITIADF